MNPHRGETLFSRLPNETLFKILLSLPYDEIMERCADTPDLAHICDDYYFWATKAKELNVSTQEFARSSLPPNKRYLVLLYEKKGICTKGSEGVIYYRTCVINAAQRRDETLLEYYAEKYSDMPNFWNDVLLGAARSRHVDIFRWAYENGADRNYAFNMATPYEELLEVLR